MRNADLISKDGDLTAVVPQATIESIKTVFSRILDELEIQNVSE
jgi:hypothetical protein